MWNYLGMHSMLPEERGGERAANRGIKVYQIRAELKNLANLPNPSVNHSQTEKRQNVWVINGHPS